MGLLAPLRKKNVIPLGLVLGMAALLSACPEETPVVEATPATSSVQTPKTPKEAPPKAAAPETTADEADPVPPNQVGDVDEAVETSELPVDETGTSDDPDEAVAGNEADIIWTDPIDWFLHRIFSRRFYRDGEEFTPATPVANGIAEEYQPTAKELRRFHARSFFKLFATNVQKHEDVQGHGESVLHRVLNALFRFRHEGFDINKVLVRITSVEVRQGSSWTTVQDFGTEGRVFDFVALHEGGILELGEFPIDPGSYTRMRLNLGEGNRIVVNEGQGEIERALVVPFFQTRRIELVRPFEVTGSGFTSVRVDFDLERSVSRGFFGAYWLTPVMRIVGVETGTPSTAMIDAAVGGVVEIMNEVTVVIPPGALSENTQVTVRPVFQLLPHQTSDLIIMGQEYLVEPEGLLLNAPAQVVMGYRQDHVEALGLAPTSLDLYTRADGERLWNSAGATLTAAEGKVQGEILTLGRMALGGKSADVDMSAGEGCVDYGDQVVVTPSALGVDPQVFYGECRRQGDCYDHGGRTYGKTVDQCLDEFYAGMQARCERLCVADYGQTCADVSSEDKASALYVELLAPLHDNCLVVAGRMFAQRQAAKESEFPTAEVQTCEDYAGLGVSCETPACTLDVDQAAIPINAATDLIFTLSFSGSVNTVEFDGSIVHQTTGLALPMEDSVTVVDEGRSLSAAKTFTALVKGPANETAQCSVTVDVTQEPDPCTIVITPEAISGGQQVNLFVTVLPGYNSAYMDIRTQGVMNPIGLSAPDGTGTRYFTSNTRPTVSRTYSALVIHDDGDQFTCSAAVTVQ